MYGFLQGCIENVFDSKAQAVITVSRTHIVNGFNIARVLDYVNHSIHPRMNATEIVKVAQFIKLEFV